MQSPSRAVLARLAKLLAVRSILDGAGTDLKQWYDLLSAKLQRIDRGLQFLVKDADRHPRDEVRRRRNFRAIELLQEQFEETKTAVARLNEGCRKYQNQVRIYNLLVVRLRRLTHLSLPTEN
ncbi:hypothetical protein PRIC1_010381 [Phytophthora ramorum]